jgi:hypothetical protein
MPDNADLPSEESHRRQEFIEATAGLRNSFDDLKRLFLSKAEAAVQRGLVPEKARCA